MSIQRGPTTYVWSDGPSMHLWVRAGTGAYDPVNYRTEGSEDYPGFVSGVAIPIEEWDAIVDAYVVQRERGVYGVQL